MTAWRAVDSVQDTGTPTVRGDRLVIGAALGTLAFASWLYLLQLSMAMERPGGPAHGAWNWGEFGALVVMWSVMMIAMMTPSAAPMVAIFTRVHRARAAQGRPAVPTAAFVLGYVATWSVFSVLAALVQTALHMAALLSPAMPTTSPLLGGGVFIVAGIFQWTPLKHACLAACRSPLSFVMSEWRGGTRGAVVMGVRHGVYCLGCCWALMALLFVAGVMNLLWVAIIAITVLLEKVLPYGERAARVAGLGLVIAGLVMVAGVLGT